MTDPASLSTQSLLALLAAIAIGACSPTVRLEAPEKPIEINLNIRIQQEVRIRVERDLEKAIDDDPAIFGVPSTKPR